jgi:hypothetical protein
MKSLHYVFLLSIFCIVVACSEPQETAVSIDPTISYDALKEVSKNPDASISHEDGWAIVSKTENDDRVYWFLAPDENGVSPAQFKKTIHVSDNNETEIKIVSQCEAPKQTCDDLMAQFKVLSDKYK